MTCLTISTIIASSFILANQVALNIFSGLRQNMSDTLLSDVVWATQRDWQSVILTFPSHNYDKSWIISVPVALLSWHLFKAIYEIEETDMEVDTPGVPEEDKKEKKASEDKLPNQGEVRGDVENAPPVDAGKQGKHVENHPNYKEGNSTWKEGTNGVNETQEAWKKGNQLPDGTKVWDTGKIVGKNGETGVRVHIDSKGRIHGYPVNPQRYLSRN